MAVTKRTVVVVGEDGRLIDVTGAIKESDTHYAKFAARLLGESGDFATLDYGWNGKTKLKITGANGEQIVLDAQEVTVPGDLTIGGTPIQDLVDGRIDLELAGLTGAEGEITVTRVQNEDSGDSGDSGEQPRNLYIVGLSQHFIDRIETIEAELGGIIRMDDVYYIGDGLLADKENEPHVLSVKIGTGLKFEDEDSSDSESPDDSELMPTSRLLSVDCDDVVQEGSLKPVTSGAVYDAIGGAASRYVVEVDSTSGNVVLYDTAEEE